MAAARRKSTAEESAADTLSALYRQMLVVRHAEEALSTLFANGEVPGFIHLSIGQEAVPVGVMSALGPDDTIASTHRGHGHALAKGLDLVGFFSELLARDTGLCRGRGGSMHVADLSIGMLGANGIVGAGLPIALGSALSHQVLGRNAVAASFFGDGALAEGLLHETFNLAKLWRLPILFVCENNGWGEFLPTSKQLAFTLKDLSASYGMPYRHVDGNDVDAVSDTSRRVVRDIRAGGGPAVMECMTHRVRGHFEGDAQKYRDQADMARNAEVDPLRLTEAKLAGMGVSAQRIDQLKSEVRAEVEAAVAAARTAPAPEFEAARLDVYTRSEAA